MDLKVSQVCQKCQGTGIYETSSDAGPTTVTPCPTCLGEKSIEIYTVDAQKIKKRLDDIDDDLAAIKTKLDI
jgi:excinuclease UvrABC ATPase subunit